MRNYLRVRGEYRSRSSGVRSRPELPPRARRIRLMRRSCPHPRGTTSACAENTPRFRHCYVLSRNYLRVRGEYTGYRRVVHPELELPPRARRILYQLITMIFTDGTTSACAENTLLSPGRRCRRWNYLRVRGEYQKDTERKTIMQELPPRARRIPLGLAQRPVCRGTTSACAENTTAKQNFITPVGNYLRVRGEYPR